MIGLWIQVSENFHSFLKKNKIESEQLISSMINNLFIYQKK